MATWIASTAAVALAGVVCTIWICLLAARGGFWRAAEQDDAAAAPAAPARWPAVVGIVPARNEALLIAEAIGSLVRQRYPGSFSVVVVDDQSDDDTTVRARQAAAAAGGADRLTVIAGSPPPRGWSGKLWAVEQGLRYVECFAAPPEFVLLTDADIVHGPDALTTLVARARGGKLVLASRMAKLRCESLAERVLIPAFVFFFQMLYPFRWVNRPEHPAAAAAGGCMLVRRDALAAAGGIQAIRGALIDDCALARRMKACGPIWLGLTEQAVSRRQYPRVEEVRRMVARTAYVQLRESPLLLAGTVLGMGATFFGPPALACFGSGAAQVLGAVAWGLMTLAYRPTLRSYHRSWAWGLVLPLIAAAYLLFTLDSAWQHWRGRGGMWKGRAQSIHAQSGNGL